MTRELENIVESIIFASPEGASTKEITRCVRGAVATAREKDGELALEAITRFADVDEVRVMAAISHLNAIYEETGRAFMLVERPAGWRIVSRMEFGPWVRELFPDKKPARLTPSALETLAIIAYRQPMTKSSIEAVRGVSVDGPLQALLDRNVVRIAGRADLPGRPLLYETTDLFLEHFGIKTVDELPNASELRSVKLPEPEDLEPALKAAKGAVPQSELPLEGTEGAAPVVVAVAAGEGKSRKKGRGRKAANEAAEIEGGPSKDVENLRAESPVNGDEKEEEVAKGPEESENEENSPTAGVEPEAEWSPAEDEPEPEPEFEPEPGEEDAETDEADGSKEDGGGEPGPGS